MPANQPLRSYSTILERKKRPQIISLKFSLKKLEKGPSLVIQWLRIYASISRGHRLDAMAREVRAPKLQSTPKKKKKETRKDKAVKPKLRKEIIKIKV